MPQHAHPPTPRSGGVDFVNKRYKMNLPNKQKLEWSVLVRSSPSHVATRHYPNKTYYAFQLSATSTRHRLASDCQTCQRSSWSHDLRCNTSLGSVDIRLWAAVDVLRLLVFIMKNSTSYTVSCPSFMSEMYRGHPLLPAGYRQSVGVLVPVPRRSVTNENV